MSNRMNSHVYLPVTIPTIIRPLCEAIDSDHEAVAYLLVELEACLSTSTIDRAVNTMGKVDSAHVSEMLKYILKRLNAPAV